MSIEIIQQRLNSYNCQTIQEEENAIKEITQEVALLALSQAGFFKEAAFHGGTCLRILHGLQRFSEDLDFALLQPNNNFKFAKYLTKLEQEFRIYGYQIEMQDRSKIENVVQKAFLKDDSVGKLLKLSFPTNLPTPKKIRIKLELDTNPPLGATVENRYHNFPLAFAATAHDLPSCYAGKLHALLCRSHIKGRDWYDFLWYLQRKVTPNLALLQNAIYQNGPWAGQSLQLDTQWIVAELSKKIDSLDWPTVSNDVARFLKPHEQKALEHWHTDFFLDALTRNF